MRITFLVLVHEAPHHVARLLSRLLEPPGNSAVLHVDAAANEQSFVRAVEEAGLADRVRLVPRRIDVKWGGPGGIRATLSALTTAVEQPVDAYVLLSGADYPIRPVAELAAGLADGAIRMESVAMPDPATQKTLDRLEHLFLPAKNRSHPIVSQVNRVLRHLPRRNVVRGLEGAAPYGGSQWWAMPHGIAVQVLAYLDTHPSTLRFFSRSLIPDEALFQTVVHAVAPDALMRPPLTWADWSRMVPPGSPPWLGIDDLDLVRTAAGEHWFVRKVHPDRSAALLDALDGLPTARSGDPTTGDAPGPAQAGASSRSRSAAAAGPDDRGASRSRRPIDNPSTTPSGTMTNG